MGAIFPPKSTLRGTSPACSRRNVPSVLSSVDTYRYSMWHWDDALCARRCEWKVTHTFSLDHTPLTDKASHWEIGTQTHPHTDASTYTHTDTPTHRHTQPYPYPVTQRHTSVTRLSKSNEAFHVPYAGSSGSAVYLQVAVHRVNGQISRTHYHQHVSMHVWWWDVALPMHVWNQVIFCVCA